MQKERRKQKITYSIVHKIIIITNYKGLKQTKLNDKNVKNVKDNVCNGLTWLSLTFSCSSVWRPFGQIHLTQSRIRTGKNTFYLKNFSPQLTQFSGVNHQHKKK